MPGGPGLGSESLKELTKTLHVPGAFWHLDFPGDGSNIVNGANYQFSNWKAALIEAINMLRNVILVAHSTGGMYVLSTPELAPMLSGLILMDSAPNATWQHDFMNYVKEHPLPTLKKYQKLHAMAPTNETLKALTLACAPYLFIPETLKFGREMLNCLPYNLQSYDWSAKNFDPTYAATWVPQDIPTLIFSGEYDYITPLKLFSQLPEFHYPKCIMRIINNAGHYPWIDKPFETSILFDEFYRLFFQDEFV